MENIKNFILVYLLDTSLLPTGIYLIVGTKNENVISHSKVFIQ